MYIYMYIYAYTYIYTYTNSHIFASLSTGFTFMVSGLLISVYIILVARSFVHCLESDQEGLAGSDSLAQVDVYIATHCNTLQHAATHCNTLQHTATRCNILALSWDWSRRAGGQWLSRAGRCLHCNTLQHTATRCNTLQHIRAGRHSHCNSPQHTVTHCNTLQHAATRCNTLQHTATHYEYSFSIVNLLYLVDILSSHLAGKCTLQHTAAHSNTLQHTATHCNTIQHTPTRSNTLQYSFSIVNSLRYVDILDSLLAGKFTLQPTATHCNTLQQLQHTATHCNTLRTCYIMQTFSTVILLATTIHKTSTEQHTATHCNTLQHTPNTLPTHSQHSFSIVNLLRSARILDSHLAGAFTLWHTVTHFNTHCNTLQNTATHCNTLQHTAIRCNTLQHTATHCNTLQHTATHCSTLQHTTTHSQLATLCRHSRQSSFWQLQYTKLVQSWILRNSTLAGCLCLHVACMLWFGSSHSHCNTMQHTVKNCNTLQHTSSNCNTLPHTATGCLEQCVCQNGLFWFFSKEWNLYHIYICSRMFPTVCMSKRIISKCLKRVKFILYMYV